MPVALTYELQILQPWRPSRGASTSRWFHEERAESTSIQPQDSNLDGSRPPAMDTPRRGQPRQWAAPAAMRASYDNIRQNGFRQARLRPPKEDHFDLSSPSRGEIRPGRR